MKKIKQLSKGSRIFAFLLCSMLCFANLNAQTPDQITWERGNPTLDDVTVTLDTVTKTMTISGTGAVLGVSGQEAWPWRDYAEHIHTVIVKEGITGLPANIFSRSFTTGGTPVNSPPNLTTVTLPTTIQVIGDNAFAGNSQAVYPSTLTSVTIPNEVNDLTIGIGAFANNIALTSINLPEGIILINSDAFQNSGFTTITVPSTANIGRHNPVGNHGEWGRAFHASRFLTTINVHPNNPYFRSIDGIMYSKDSTILHAYPGGRTEEYFYVPNFVKTIGNHAFALVQDGRSLTHSLSHVVLHAEIDTILPNGFTNYNKNIICLRPTPPAVAATTALWSGANTARIVRTVYVPQNSLQVYRTHIRWGHADPAFTFRAAETLLTSLTITGDTDDFEVEIDPFQSQQRVLVPESTTQVTIAASSFMGTPTITGAGVYQLITPLEAGINVITLEVKMDTFIKTYILTIDPLSWEIGAGADPSVVTASLNDNILTIKGEVNAEISPARAAITFGPNVHHIVFEDGITALPANLFGSLTENHFPNLKSITLSNTIQTIGNNAISPISSLASIVAPTGNLNFTSVDGVLYSKDTNQLLQYPTSRRAEYFFVPNAVEIIGYGAFQVANKDVSPIHTIVLHANVKEILENAFHNFNTQVICLATTLPTVDLNSFGSTATSNLGCILFVPNGSIAAYRDHAVWGATASFAEIRPAESLLESLTITAAGGFEVKLGPLFRTEHFVIVPDGVTTINITAVAFFTASPLFSITGGGAKTLENGVNAFEISLQYIMPTVPMGTHTIIVADQASVNAMLNGLKADNAVLNKEIEILTDDVSALNDSITTLNDEITELERQITVLFAEVQKWRDSVGVLWLEIDNLETLLDNCEGMLTSSAPKISDEQITISPNPVSHELRITGHQWRTGDVVEIFNMNGQRVVSTPGGFAGTTDDYVINMSSFQAGSYLLRIGNRVATIIKK
jgi:hypothetical protein